MKSSETVLEPRLAWTLWQGLGKLSDLLWDRYEEEFLEIISRKDEMDDYQKTILNLTKLDLPF